MGHGPIEVPRIYHLASVSQPPGRVELRLSLSMYDVYR
jgi:hypothetical protein